MPFLALSGKHGYNDNLNKVKHGVGINMRSMNSVDVAKDGKSATIGGGIVTKQLTDTLWEKGKLTSMCPNTPFNHSRITINKLCLLSGRYM